MRENMPHQNTDIDGNGGLVLGIDGGGTKTEVAVTSTKAKKLLTLTEKATRLETIGVDRASEIIENSIHRILDELQVNKDAILSACFGFGGLDTIKDKKQANSIANEIFPNLDNLSVTSDSIIGLHSGTFGDPGLCIISGTGALIGGVNLEGTTDRVNGWGHLFGDLGSAYYIGQEAVIKSLEAFDGRGENTSLKDRIVKRLPINRIAEATDHFYRLDDRVKKIAELSVEVNKAAVAGDEVAKNILSSAAKELSRSATTLIKKLDLDSMKHVPIVLIGGVFNSSILTSTLKGLISQRCSNVLFIRPAWKPVVGAIVLALKKIEKDITEEIRETLKEEFSDA